VIPLMPIGLEIITAPWWKPTRCGSAWELEQHGVTAAMRMIVEISPA